MSTAERTLEVLPKTTLSTAIHIGASSVSMLVCEVSDDTPPIPVEFLEQPVPFARDIFRRGSIALDTTERIVSILHGYQATLQELGASSEAIRVVATNILAEADNQDVFLNRIRIACGLAVDTIDDGEMTRLIYLKTRRRLQDIPAMKKCTTLVVHVGPGNTRALLFQNGSITRYTSYRLGTHRTLEAVEGSHAEGSAFQRVIREHASGNLGQMRFDFRDVKIEAMVVIGYEIQTVAPVLPKPGQAMPIKAMRKIASEVAALPDVELVKRFQVDYQTASALLPAIEINLAAAEVFGLEELHIPPSDYEQGLLQDILMSRDLSGGYADEVLRSARILATKYQSDPRHGAHVGEMCQKLFDELSDIHRLTRHDALLLQVAAVLHEVGSFISPRAHHKHSEYIILNSEIFGLDRLDVTIVAMVARYHRHSPPRLDHVNYHDLSTENRIRVSKLAAILRVADALERTHDQRVSGISLRRDDHKLTLVLHGVGDAAVERLAMQSKADLFERVFGLEVVIEEQR